MSLDLDCLQVAQAAGLSGGKKSGGEQMYLCPCHEDHDPSLGINLTKNTWYCHACAKGGSAWDFVAFINGWDSTLNKREIIHWLRTHGIWNGQGDGFKSSQTLEATYVYEDEDRNPLFRVKRYRRSDGSKSFPQERYENGKWVSGLKDKKTGEYLVKPVPYRLPDFLDKKGVCVFEGEKNVDDAWEMEIPATCNPMGAGKWRKEYNPSFKDKQIFIFPDNDTAGRNHAHQVAVNLYSVAKELKIVELPGLPEKGDFSDWKAAGGTKEELREIIRKTPPVTQEDIEAWKEAFVSSVSSSPEHIAEIEWLDPESLPELAPPVPRLPEELLPGPIRPWVSDIAERKQVPPEYIAVPAIVTIGSVIGRNIGIHPKQRDDWFEVPNLWGAIVGGVSTLKTPSCAEAMRPLSKLIEAARQRFKEDQERQEIEIETLQAQIENTKKEMRKAANDAEQLNLLKTQLVNLRQDEKDSCVIERRYKTHDTTIEKLGELLSENPRGILLYRDELSGWIRMLHRQGREGDREFFLECWNGTGSYDVDRIGRGSIQVEALCLSILGSMQPSKLDVLVQQAVKGGWEDDGLLQRFQMLVYPEPVTPWKNVDRRPDLDARERVIEIFRKLDKLEPASLGSDLSTVREVPMIGFNPDAQELFDEWLEKLMNRLPTVCSPAFQAHLSKYRKLMPALALIFHLVDLVAGGCETAVSLDSARQAAAWCDFLEIHAKKVYAGAIQPDVRAAYELANKIKEGRVKDATTMRNIYRHGWTLLNTREDVEAALSVLEECNWVRLETHPTEGRDRTAIRLHPSLRGEAK